MRRNIHLFISILLFFIGYSVDANSDEKKLINKYNVPNNDLSTKPLLDTAKHSAITFIEQEINYYAPLSGSVNLAWSIANYPLDESLCWNDNTKMAFGLMYLPMEAHGDTFSIKLKIPVGSMLQYYFWISKNKQGVFQDYWDKQSSDKITVTDGLPINKNAIYKKAEKKRGSQILSKGWFILIFLIGVYLLLFWLQKKWVSKIEAPSEIERVLFIGLSLIIFHALARSEIIQVSLFNTVHNFDIIPKIIRGSISDLLYICGLVVLFIMAISFVKNVRTRRWIFGVFIFLH